MEKDEESEELINQSRKKEHEYKKGSRGGVFLTSRVGKEC